MEESGKGNLMTYIVQGIVALLVALSSGYLAGWFSGNQTAATLQAQHEQFIAAQAQQFEIFQRENNAQMCLIAASYINIADVPEAREYGLDLMLATCPALAQEGPVPDLNEETRDRVISGALNVEFRQNNGETQLWLVPQNTNSSIEPELIAPALDLAVPIENR